MAILDWPTQERPRERLVTLGAAALSEAELLAIFLRSGIKGKTAVDLARDLLQRCGGLRKLLDLSYQQFLEIPGLGTAKYSQLQAALEISRRYFQEIIVRHDVLQNSADTCHYLLTKLRHHAREIFACLFLDTQNRVICYEELFRGSIDHASVYPREVVKRVLANNAAAVILAHNHPSGIAKPSEADKQITLRLKQALDLIEVRILDHIVVGDGQMASLAELGWI